MNKLVRSKRSSLSNLKIHKIFLLQRFSPTIHRLGCFGLNVLWHPILVWFITFVVQFQGIENRYHIDLIIINSKRANGNPIIVMG